MNSRGETNCGVLESRSPSGVRYAIIGRVSTPPENPPPPDEERPPPPPPSWGAAPSSEPGSGDPDETRAVPAVPPTSPFDAGPPPPTPPPGWGAPPEEPAPGTYGQQPQYGQPQPQSGQPGEYG